MSGNRTQPVDEGDERRILLVEDSPEEAELFCQALTIAWDTVASQHGLSRPTVTLRRQAADAAEFRTTRSMTESSLLPTLIVLDFDLPGETSLPFLKRLRGDLHLNRVPVVVMGWSEDDRLAHPLPALGVADYLVKPLRFAELIELANGLCWKFLLPTACPRLRQERP
ncbi:MAG TPA: response regulator [Nitrospiraceae bacterium]|nr:response regulator [Nitrospiraceae bacterium]